MIYARFWFSARIRVCPYPSFCFFYLLGFNHYIAFRMVFGHQDADCIAFSMVFGRNMIIYRTTYTCIIHVLCMYIHVLFMYIHVYIYIHILYIYSICIYKD